MKINGNPDGGGGKSAVIESLSVTSNGTYTAGGGVDGYSPVEVSVPERIPVTESLSVSVNNTYYPGQGVDGFSQVIVDVPQSVTGYTEKDLTERDHAIVNLNNSASFVAEDAFEDYKALQTVTLPNCSVVNMSGFKGCEYITSVSLPICKTLNGGAFYNCYRISSFYAPMLELVGAEAFYYNKWMTADIDFPVCSYIGNYAFTNCSSITSVNLPECLSIGNGAFSSCISLSYVNIPNCSYIGQNAFISCKLLSSINIPNCSYISSGAFDGCSSLSTATLTNLLSMGENAFRSCGLESLYLPKCLNVPNYVFQNNSDLSVISLPRVMSIGYYGFYGDSKISVIDLPFLMGQGGQPFQSIVPTSINLPIFSNMYYNASYNTFGWSLNLASEVHFSMGNKLYFVPSYSNRLGLSSILSYNNCTIYVDAAMYDKWVSATGWSSLSTIFSVEGDPTVPMLSFSDGLLYGKTEALFQYWFSSNSYGISINSKSVTNVSLPECRYLSMAVFAGLSQITSITLPKCEYMEQNVFSRCYSLATLEIPNCRYIGSSAFLECYSLPSITLTGSDVCILASTNAFWPASIPCQVYVPASLYDAYLSAPNWSNISSRIHIIE